MDFGANLFDFELLAFLPLQPTDKPDGQGDIIRMIRGAANLAQAPCVRFVDFLASHSIDN